MKEAMEESLKNNESEIPNMQDCDDSLLSRTEILPF